MNAAGKVRAVFFDLDDTLFDHWLCTRTAVASLQEQHPRLGRQPLDDLHREYLRLVEETHLLVLAGALTSDAAREQRLQRLFAGSGEPLGRERLAEIADHYRGIYLAARRPLAGAAALLTLLHDRVTIGVITNNFTAEQQDKLRCCGLDHLVDHLVTSEDVGAAKPALSIYQAALDRAGCRPDEAVMVGDSWAWDVVGAHRAGLRTVWLNRHGRPCPDPSIATQISSFEPTDQVANLLLGLETDHA